MNYPINIDSGILIDRLQSDRLVESYLQSQLPAIFSCIEIFFNFLRGDLLTSTEPSVFLVLHRSTNPFEKTGYRLFQLHLPSLTRILLQTNNSENSANWCAPLDPRNCTNCCQINCNKRPQMRRVKAVTILTGHPVNMLHGG